MKRLPLILAGFSALALWPILQWSRASSPQRAEVKPRAGRHELHAVILGDSVAFGAGDETGRGIAGWLDRRLAESGVQSTIANLGVNGARTPLVRRLIEQRRTRSLLAGADAVIVSIGGNDLYGNTPGRLLTRFVPDIWQELTVLKVQGIVNEIHAANPTAVIYVLGLYDAYRHTPLHAFLDRQVNLWDSRLIAHFADDPQVKVIRICDLIDRPERISVDRFHPGGAGYAAIADRIAASVQTGG